MNKTSTNKCKLASTGMIIINSNSALMVLSGLSLHTQVDIWNISKSQSSFAYK